MNLEELGFNLKCRREFKRISDGRMLCDLTVHELSCIEHGHKCSIKVLSTYLEVIDACLMFLKKDIDHGLIQLKGDKVTLYSQVFNKDVSTFKSEDTISLLRYLNKYDYRIRVRFYKQGLNYQPTRYPNQLPWNIVKQINSELLKRINQSNVSWEALARSVHMSKDGLENFLYGVVNYDFKFINIISKKIGYIGVFCLKEEGHFCLDYIDNKLYKIYNNQDKEKGEFIPKPRYALLSESPNHKIVEVAELLSANGFVKVFFASNGSPDFSLKKDEVDDTGQKPIHKYSPRELESIVKWRSNGIGNNLFCDYCRTRGAVKFYSTTDGRDIQLCKQCKDKVHPTNNYVKIIYTATGGSNKRW